MFSAPALTHLRAQIACIEGEGGRISGVLPCGLPHLDHRLPGSGLALGCLHEVAGGGNGAVDGASAACFAAGIAARLSGPVLWCVTLADIFAPGLAQAGLHPDRVIHVEAGDDKDVLACMEEGLRHGGLAAVVAEAPRLPMTASRRLHLAAPGRGLGLRPAHGGHDAPADLGAAVGALAGVGRGAAALARGADPGAGGRALRDGTEGCDETDHLGLPAELADGPAAAHGGRRNMAH